MNTYLQAGVSGVMTGGLYAVMALGLSLTWGLLKVINLAHFALILRDDHIGVQRLQQFAMDAVDRNALLDDGLHLAVDLGTRPLQVDFGRGQHRHRADAFRIVAFMRAPDDPVVATERGDDLRRAGDERGDPP